MTDINKPKKVYKLRTTLDVLLWAIHTWARGCKRSSTLILPDFSHWRQIPTVRHQNVTVRIRFTHHLLEVLEVWYEETQFCKRQKQNKTTPPPNLKYHPTNFKLMLHLNNSYILLVIEFQQLNDHPSWNTSSYHLVLSKWSLLG